MGQSDENDENEALSVRLSQLKQEKENAESMQDKLNLLSSSLDSIRSQPMIIDLTKKRQRNHDLSQQLIGRQMKLRDYRQKYEKMQTDLKNIKRKKEEETKQESEYLKEFESLNETQL